MGASLDCTRSDNWFQRSVCGGVKTANKKKTKKLDSSYLNWLMANGQFVFLVSKLKQLEYYFAVQRQVATQGPPDVPGAK